MEKFVTPYQIKSEFCLPSDCYFLSHSVGCRPRSTEEAIRKFLHSWDERGGEAWPLWLDLLGSFQEQLAQLLNSSRDQFCPQTNLSSALTKIIQSFPIKDSGKNILLLSPYDFPSMGYVIQMASKLNFKVRFLECEVDQPHLNLEIWDKNLTSDVHLALITHVYSNNGQLQNVATISRWCQEREVISVVDVAQSIGIVPIDLQNWFCDFVIGTTMKWCCGGPGAGFLWVNPHILQNTFPLDVGWFSHKDPFQFDIHHFEYADNAYRFLGGTPSILPYMISTKSLALLNQIGSLNLWRHNQKLVQYIINFAQEHSIALLSPIDAYSRGGTVVIEHKDTNSLQRVLREHSIFVDGREHGGKEGIRISPHIYSDLEAVEHTCKKIIEYR